MPFIPVGPAHGRAAGDRFAHDRAAFTTGPEVTLLAKVVAVDAPGKRSLVSLPDGSRVWIAWAEGTLLAVSGDLSVFTDSEE